MPLDEGLAVISRHARDLGYDALVLFLDELILWLATHAADFRFLNEEGPKVSKLVEAETAGRPIPIVSFVARQRDLRELVGEQVTGALQLGFADVLQWWEARFEGITLEDRNLPEIAARRLLRPRDHGARQQIDSAYAETEKVRRDVFETLLTPRADRAMFRKVYPFSPALVETLVAVSSLLQRERTALKVMLQILVDGRETLDLGEIVPVGDLFDALAEGDEPFTESTRHHFENARNLYRRKLLPLIERRHGISKAEAETRPKSDTAARALRAEDRLAKTLLLAALAPEVEVLKNLTAGRLAALNHGSIRTPIEGREGQEVLRRCRAWAAEIGEVRIGDHPANPTIAMQLSAVDTESILADAGRHDNTGNRRRLIREILFSELGIEDRDELILYHDVAWRGTERRFEVIFANVRELPDESLSTRGDERKVIVDFPFDEPGRTPADDLARLNDFRGRDARARTLVWLPSFLSAAAQRDLGTLVRIDHVLRGDRLRDFAAHLSPVDRASARELLRNQQSQLRQRLIHYLEGAYGVENPPPGSVDQSHPLAEHFQSLEPAFEPRPPARAHLRGALEGLFDQMCASQYPAHPDFGAPVKTTVLRRVRVRCRSRKDASPSTSRSARRVPAARRSVDGDARRSARRRGAAGRGVAVAGSVEDGRRSREQGVRTDGVSAAQRGQRKRLRGASRAGRCRTGRRLRRTGRAVGGHRGGLLHRGGWRQTASHRPCDPRARPGSVCAPRQGAGREARRNPAGHVPRSDGHELPQGG